MQQRLLQLVKSARPKPGKLTMVGRMADPVICTRRCIVLQFLFYGAKVPFRC